MTDALSTHIQMLSVGSLLPAHGTNGNIYWTRGWRDGLVATNQVQTETIDIPMGSSYLRPILVPRNTKVYVSCDDGFGSTNFPVDIKLYDQYNYNPAFDGVNGIVNPDASSVEGTSDMCQTTGFHLYIKGRPVTNPVTGNQSSYGGQVTIAYWIQPLPEVDFLLLGGNQYKANSPIQFINRTLIRGTFVSVLWTFDDGNISTDYNPVHTYLTPGTYNVSLMVENEFGSSTRHQVIKINDETLKSLHIAYTADFVP